MDWTGFTIQSIVLISSGLREFRRALCNRMFNSLCGSGCFGGIGTFFHGRIDGSGICD
jgi:hypothetical protein